MRSTLPQDPEMPFGLCKVMESTALVCIIALPFPGHVILDNSNSQFFCYMGHLCYQFHEATVRIKWNNVINVFSVVSGT